MQIVKVFNNNVVLAKDDEGRDTVLMGRGIGFQAKPGAAVDRDKIHRLFRPSVNNSPGRIAAYLDSIGARELDLASEIVEMGREEFGAGISDATLLPLADHIDIALRRAEAGIEIEYPLRWEVEGLYPREVAFGRRALACVQEQAGQKLPELECIPFALHFANAQFDSSDMAITMDITRGLGRILQLTSELLGVNLDTDSLDVARYVTHLRYLTLRTQQAETRGENMASLLDALLQTRPTEVEQARALGDELGRLLSVPIDDNEVVYLSLHLCRLKDAINVSVSK